MLKDLAIIGCGGHSRSVADILLKKYKDVEIIFYDENAQRKEYIFENYPVKKINKSLEIENRNVFIAIGDNDERKAIAEKLLLNMKYNFPSIISNNAYLGIDSKIGKGSLLADGTHIGPSASIGDFTIINTHAIIEHEVKIGKFCHISVNSTVCGRSYLGDKVFLGAGAVVKDKVSICNDVTIGAGGVVCSDISEPGIYVGCPARKI